MFRLLAARTHAHHNALASPETCVKGPERNDQNPVITFRATYTPVSKRAGERSHKKPTPKMLAFDYAFALSSDFLTTCAPL
ncbi:hypothetical protein LC0644_1427 [Lacticaseibacillus paracasei NRIC 0644]|uniref:Uncharacterized protein n=1 Tax=Lacticaseibacillus paracasei NRIC 0644 TaxID=1435038 RepID=A0A0C9QDV7_LACPA|nr:hypothetical protein LC0644_1427 [Lacticaseibacillus paracasei NRIC 0644]